MSCQPLARRPVTPRRSRSSRCCAESYTPTRPHSGAVTDTVRAGGHRVDATAGLAAEIDVSKCDYRPHRRMVQQFRLRSIPAPSAHRNGSNGSPFGEQAAPACASQATFRRTPGRVTWGIRPTFAAVIGRSSEFSSVGPTRNGRRKPEHLSAGAVRYLRLGRTQQAHPGRPAQLLRQRPAAHHRGYEHGGAPS